MSTLKITVRDGFGNEPYWMVGDTVPMTTSRHETVLASAVEVGDVMCFDHKRGVCAVEVISIDVEVP
jgi:hypothetical protein